ncbi:hypothetical protein TNCV_556991 [Trichonephila clavipes]|uniref:Uncharacterized protein n=1 Tax=Trichonephila clavipes TaxID=2585209 RepID=A0A8X6RQY4_TRICX|nr:hypothetical protein TNCV_556991 [Trichonephila clavipes]
MTLRGHGSLKVKVTDSWLACHEFEPSTTENPPYLGNNFEPPTPHPGGSAKDGHALPLVSKTDICHCAHEGIECNSS